VVPPDDLQRWRTMFSRLRRGPSPRGERFELCREVLAVTPESNEGREAARQLLEGAMADAKTSIADAQDVMRVLKAATRGELDLVDLSRAS
jgi:hypothetical protein